VTVRHALALAMIAGLAGVALTVLPGRTVRRIEALRAALERDPDARLVFYRRVVASTPLVVAAVAVVAAVGGIGARGVGIAWPPYAWERLLPATVGGLGGFVLVMLAIAAATGRLREGRTANESARVLLPQSRRERRLWPLVALGVGVTEEALFRGLFVFAPHALAPALPRPALVVASAAGFGIGHRYQGWYGVVGTGLLGTVFGLVAVVTGSLVPAVALHAIWDMAVPNGLRRAERRAAAPVPDEETA
jgi:membrane protease YdiL (CAAX protease family)